MYVSVPPTRRRGVSQDPAATQPVSIHMARAVSAPLDAACATLNTTGVRKEEIDCLILIQQKELACDRPGMVKGECSGSESSSGQGRYRGRWE